jgi:hypothetical protein
MFKKYIQLLIWFYTLSITSVVLWKEEYKNAMLPQVDWTDDGVIDVKLTDGTWEDQVDSIFAWIRDAMETLLPIVAVWVFLFVGIRIAIAKWNPEEFKKAWMQMIYAVVGIFVVWFAWAAVKLVAGLNI